MQHQEQSPDLQSLAIVTVLLYHAKDVVAYTFCLERDLYVRTYDFIEPVSDLGIYGKTKTTDEFSKSSRKFALGASTLDVLDVELLGQVCFSCGWSPSWLKNSSDVSWSSCRHILDIVNNSRTIGHQ